MMSLRSSSALVATVFVVCALVFGALLIQVWDGGRVVFDEPVMLWMHSVSTPWLTDVAQAVTHLGGRIVQLVAFAVAVVLCVLRRWADAVIVVAAVVGASRINVMLKPIIERARPDFWEHMTVEATYSFPSGHTMAAMSIAAPLVYLAWKTRYRWPVLVVAALYAFAVGTTRSYLGVHFPSDVLAGWCLTVLWVVLVEVVVRYLARRLRRRGRDLADFA